MTSWSVVFSISAIRSTSMWARASIAANAATGTVPRATWARATAISTSSMCPKRASSVQTAPIAGSVYRRIT